MLTCQEGAYFLLLFIDPEDKERRERSGQEASLHRQTRVGCWKEEEEQEEEEEEERKEADS